MMWGLAVKLDPCTKAEICQQILRMAQCVHCAISTSTVYSKRVHAFFTMHRASQKTVATLALLDLLGAIIE